MKETAMTCQVAVTFEFETRPPLTWRGTVTAWGVQTVVHRATTEAKKALRPINWSSMVCCVLERQGGDDALEGSGVSTAGSDSPAPVGDEAE